MWSHKDSREEAELVMMERREFIHEEREKRR